MESLTEIREAVREDIDIITGFQKAMAWETEQMSLDEATLMSGVEAVFRDRSKGTYFVALSEGEIVASLLITYEWSDWRNRNVWWIQSVYVVPGARRRGIFTAMYRHISKESSARGAAGLRLYVESGNRDARRTYESLGMDSSHYTMYEHMTP